MDFRCLLAGVAVVALAGAAPAHAAIEPLAAKFGAREGMRGASIAPDGQRVVVIVPRAEGGENAVVIEVASGAVTPILSSTKPLQHVAGCKFVLADRVVCSVIDSRGSGLDVESMSRLFSISIDGKDVRPLSPPMTANSYYVAHFGGDIVDYNVPGKPDSVLMSREFVPQNSTGNLTTGTAGEGLGVEEVDLRTGVRHTVIAPIRTASNFMSDGLGHVRIAALDSDSSTGYAQLRSAYRVRPAEGGTWSALSVSQTTDTGLSTGFEPIAVDAAENTAFGLDGNAKGFNALYKLALDGSGTRSEVLSRNDAGVDELLRIGRSRRIIGASFVAERRLVQYFDPAYRALAGGLAKALGGKQISFVDASADEKKLLVLASNDTDPGTLYFYDRDTHALAEILPVRPELAGFHGAEMKPVTYTAADGAQVPAYLTVPAGSDGRNLPAIVLPHGGPGARDEWGFDWLVQYFAARGFAVLQPQFRGSTGFGSDWFGQNGFKAWRSALGDVNDAGRYLLKSGIAAPGKLAIFGWSYGGYAALQTSVLDPDLFKAIVAVAPVTDFDAWRAEVRDNYYHTYRDNLVGTGPHVAEGSPARHADAIKAPVLLFHGDMDINVQQSESKLMADRLRAAGKQVTYVPFKGLDHQLDDSAARTQLLSDSDAFIRKALGM